MQLVPSLHRLGRSSLVNSYLIVEPGGITIVDAGLPGHWADLMRELDAIGRTPADIRALILTHGDVDHVGFAERLRREHRVPVFVSEGDASEARGETKKPPAARDPMRIGPTLRFLVFGLRHGGLRRTPIDVVGTFDANATLDLPGSPRVIPLPGHTPGSVAFHVPRLGALFVGDAMTTRVVTTGVAAPALGPFTVDREQALRSLDALDGLAAALVLPGHGDPWMTGLPEALAAIRTSEHRAEAGAA